MASKMATDEPIPCSSRNTLKRKRSEETSADATFAVPVDPPVKKGIKKTERMSKILGHNPEIHDDELQYYEIPHILVGDDPKLFYAIYECYCGERFHNRDDFKLHITPTDVEVKLSGIPVEDDSPPAGKYGCDVDNCNSWFDNKAELRKHKSLDH